MRSQLNVGIIGAGRIGKVHAETIAFRVPEATLLAVTDINSKAADDLAQSCGFPHVVDRAEDILGNRDIDAVLICSSTSTHADLVVAARSPSTSTSTASTARWTLWQGPA
jgi:myo-inositol 2-dehydrogenase / D-chiro-inositol 1-dehydrogenase